MEENKETKKEDTEVQETYSYTTYLVGAMQTTAEKDDGQGKREYIEKELLLRNVYPINPVRQEAGKTGMNTQILKEKMDGWLQGGKRLLFKEKSKDIWIGRDVIEEDTGRLIHIMGDLDYVITSDFITFVLNKGDKPCGSYMEAGVALEHKIPIYIISDINKTDPLFPRSLLQAMEAVDGELFENFTQFLKFLDEKYKLKREEEKK
jgi:hypothetical protein